MKYTTKQCRTYNCTDNFVSSYRTEFVWIFVQANILIKPLPVVYNRLKPKNKKFTLYFIGI